MVEIKDFSFRYPDAANFALQEINLKIPRGDFVGITGASDAGKSTLAYAMNGVIPHHYSGDFYGEVLLDGQDTVTTPLSGLAKSAASVFGDIDAQMVSMVVEDEIMFGMENYGIPYREAKDRMDSLLHMAGIGELKQRVINTLSGGQKQKVLLCAAMALLPKVLILDEPTAELDPYSSIQIFQMLKTLNEEFNTTIIIVEQKIALLCEYVRHMAVLLDGTLLAYGPVEAVAADGQALERAGVHCPRIVTLARRLQTTGLYNGKIPTSMAQAERMVQEILQTGDRMEAVI